MEVKINREIRNYTESMFFGLTMRQFVFSLLAVGVAVGLYFLLRPYVGTETVSWMCVLGAAPFAALGFVSYHGMTAEQFLWAWFRSEMLEPREIRFEPVNYYYETSLTPSRPISPMMCWKCPAPVPSGRRCCPSMRSRPPPTRTMLWMWPQ